MFRMSIITFSTVDRTADSRKWTADSRQKTVLSFEPSYQNKSGSEYVQYVQDDYYTILEIQNSHLSTSTVYYLGLSTVSCQLFKIV